MFFAIYGHGCHLGHVTWDIHNCFCSAFPRRLHIKFGLSGPEVSKKTFENGGQRRRTPEHRYTINSPMSLRLR